MPPDLRTFQGNLKLIRLAVAIASRILSAAGWGRRRTSQASGSALRGGRLPFRDAGRFFLAGEVAFRGGIARSAAPHASGTRELIAWQAGWDAAEEEASDPVPPLPDPDDGV